MLDAQAIIHEAETAAGVADAEAPRLTRNLERLAEAMDAGPPMPLASRDLARQMLVTRSRQRLEGLRWLEEHPEIADEPIEAPVFLTGLPRSGTTALQYLFDRDPRFRQVRTWEAADPFPPPGWDPDSVARRKAAERAQPSTTPLPDDMKAMHLMDLDGPQECHLFLEQAYAAAGFHNMLDVDGYFDFLADELDFVDAYRVHRRQLQLLQWRLPRPRWALKYPNHVMALDAMVEVYPDARFVMTHRDPVQTLASISKLTFKLRGMRYERPVDPHEVGRQMLHFVRRHIDGIMAFTEGPHADKVVHVDYYRLLGDPAAMMGEAQAGLGMDSPPEVRAAIAEWRRANPKGARGANPYGLEEFGLKPGAVAEQFADYAQRFDIPGETAALARVAAAR
jgi:hypothetical protein